MQCISTLQHVEWLCVHVPTCRNHRPDVGDNITTCCVLVSTPYMHSTSTILEGYPYCTPL